MGSMNFPPRPRVVIRGSVPEWVPVVILQCKAFIKYIILLIRTNKDGVVILFEKINFQIRKLCSELVIPVFRGLMIIVGKSKNEWAYSPMFKILYRNSIIKASHFVVLRIGPGFFRDLYYDS